MGFRAKCYSHYDTKSSPDAPQYVSSRQKVKKISYKGAQPIQKISDSDAF